MSTSSSVSLEASNESDPRDAVNRKDEHEDRWRALARNESRAVASLRVLVILVLFVACVTVSTQVHKYIEKDQIEDFERDFSSNAEKIVSSFHSLVLHKLQALDAMSVAITSFAQATGATFPNVTIPDFVERASNTRVLAGSALLNYCVLVEEEERITWEAYNRERRAEYFQTTGNREAALIQYQDGYYDHEVDRNLQQTLSFHDFISDLGPTGVVAPAEPETGPYLPVAQISPAVNWTTSFNFNLFSHPSSAVAYKKVIESGTVVLERADNLIKDDYGVSSAYFQLVYASSQFRRTVDEYLGDPATSVGYPVFDSLDLTTRKPVGVLAVTLYWRLQLINILPPNARGARGIICVLSNNFNQSMTFRVDGSQAVYVGPGDLHDDKYSDLRRSQNINEHVSHILSPETTSYTTAELNNEYSTYTLDIYPSQDTEDLFVNKEATTITWVIIGVFAFAASVFFIYDVLVARRQRTVMSRAIASSAIVTELFPEQIRTQLYEENAKSESKRVLKGIKDYFLGDNEVVTGNQPIADYFENTTVFFADIVGFTQWSSSRKPEEVFVLLESVYKAFDSIADRFGVFKIETIGDCYVAVAGLPQPQENHCVNVAKFAAQCLVEIRKVTQELAKTLGEETTALDLRIGMHSGPVTGGVLRGQKSRFQLFGDTMNTASRMETNGKPGRIQASLEAAYELKARGKSEWLKKRDDPVVAKGKGVLSTFWVTPKSKSATTRETHGTEESV